MFNLDNLRPQDKRPLILSNGSDGIILRIGADGNCLFKAVVEGYKYLSIIIEDYISDHEKLRAKVAQELIKSKYVNIINATLSNRKGVTIDAITKHDRETYINNIANPGVEGDIPEIHAIANILKMRIIIHKNGTPIKIPQGAEYDAWQELIELIHEPVDAGLSSAIPTDEKSNNHYNLVISKTLGGKVVNDYHHEKILAIKAKLLRWPHPSSKEADDFKYFFFSILSYHKTILEENPDTQLKHKYFYHLEMLWEHLLYEFMMPYWFNSETEKRYCPSGVGIDTKKLKTLIKEASQRNELKSFFESYQYVKDLLIIDEYLSTHNHSDEQTTIFIEILSNYLAVSQYHDQIQPLLVLREHVKLMLSRADFDPKFYKKYMKGANANLKKHDTESNLLYLSLFIRNNISYDLRMSAGFKKFNWDAFDGLFRSWSQNQSTISISRLDIIIEGLENYLDDLILFKLGQIPEKYIRNIDVNDVALANTTHNIAPAFQIIENYLEILFKITEDSETSRLATLRAITAIGETIRSVSLLLPEQYRKSLEVITNIRDHIIHSSTLEAFNYVNELVCDNSKTLLAKCLTELRNLREFFTNLKDWFANGRQPTTFPQIPSLQNLTLLESEFVKARSKDDRDERIPIAQRMALLSSLPANDNIANPAYQQIKDFMLHGQNLNKNDFTAACPMLNASDAKKLHEQVVELKKITALKKALIEKNVDFGKINLNVPKDKKDRLLKIKEQKSTTGLEELLNEHEKTIGLSQQQLIDFVNSKKTIDIKPYKLLLKKFAEEGLDKIKKAEFKKAIKVVFKDNSNHQKLWEMTYEMLTKNHIDSFKRYHIIQLDYAIKNIERLRTQLTAIFNGKSIDIKSNPVAAIACEMLYGFCLEGFKNIKKFLSRMYDYQDQTLYFFKPNHPLKEVEILLEGAIEIRNSIFHFERIYFHGEDNIEFSRMEWFSFIQDLIHGTFFPDATVVSSTGITKKPLMSDPTLQTLEKLRDIIAKDLDRDENLINMYEVIVNHNHYEPLRTIEDATDNSVTSQAELLDRRGVFSSTSQALLDDNSLLSVDNNSDCRLANIEH